MGAAEPPSRSTPGPPRRCGRSGELVDYGFAYRRDPKFPQDDITWFLMRRR